MEAGQTTVVRDIGTCLVIIRNVPCYKCSECMEVMYNGTVAKKIEKIVEAARGVVSELSIVDYTKAA